MQGVKEKNCQKNLTQVKYRYFFKKSNQLFVLSYFPPQADVQYLVGKLLRVNYRICLTDPGVKLFVGIRSFSSLCFCLTLRGPESSLARAKSVRRTSGVPCFGRGLPSISSLHLTSLWRHELLQILRLGQSLFEGPTRCCHSLHDQYQSASGPSHLIV